MGKFGVASTTAVGQVLLPVWYIIVNVEDEHGNKDLYPTWPGAPLKFVLLAD